MAEGRNFFRRRRLSLWTRSPQQRRQSQLERILTKLEQRQRPPSPPILSRLICWRSTAPESSSRSLSTAKLARSLQSSRRGLGRLERTALLLDRLCPLQPGTRLLWRPCSRLKHRIAAWLLCQLTPVLLDGLLTRCSIGVKPSRAVSLAMLPRQPLRDWIKALPLRRWHVLIVRHLCRKMTEP